MCRGFRPAFTLSPDNRLHPKHVLLYRCEETDAVAVAHASRWDMVSLERLRHHLARGNR